MVDFMVGRGLAMLYPHLAGTRQASFATTFAELGVGESATLSLSLGAEALAQSDHAGNRVLLPGEYDIVFSDGAHEVAASTLRVTGERAVIVEGSAFRAPVEAA